ncbi:MAG: ABC transporter ATP-binding protein [Acidimicrobiia bacterium]
MSCPQCRHCGKSTIPWRVWGILTRGVAKARVHLPARLRARLAPPARALVGLARLGRRFRPHFAGQWKLLAAGMAAMVGEVMLRILEPWPLKFIFDRVLQTDPDQAATGVAVADRLDPLLLLLLSAAAVVVLTGLRALSSYLATVSFALAGNRVLTRVRSDVYRHLQRLSLSFHHRAQTGDLITRVTGDVGRLQEVAVTAALPLTVNALTLVGMLAVMLWVNWQLTLVALAALPLFSVTMARLSGRIRTVARKQRQIEGALASVAAESLGAIQVVQAYSLEGTFDEVFDAHNRSSLKDGVKGKRLAAALERKTDLFVALGTGLVLYFGARLVLSGALTPGDLIVFVTYLKNAFKPMRDMAKYTGRLAKAVASGERILELLDTESDVRDRPGARPAPRFAGEIRLEGVDLSYQQGHPVLREVDFRVAPGETVALVGPSGAGKSTIVGLLLRLYDPDRGRVLVDGFDLRDLTLSSLRSQIAIVLQESVLFRATIRENIAYGSPDAGDDDVVRAAVLANAHDFIEALPDGYQTLVGERGVTLSGGERQRIAIARAAIRDARIVLLDEPTTGLDQQNQDEVLQALLRLGEGRTAIHIAHDLTAVEDSDRIIYLDGGAIIQEGTHEELLGRGGHYATIHAFQRRMRDRNGSTASGREQRARRA